MSAIKKLSFDCVVPSSIFFNENLEASCVKCYAIIRNLTKMEGYCFASNAYLAEAMECDISTVKRWIQSLESEGYLEIEHDTSRFNPQRRIFISDKFKKVLQRLKNEPPPAQIRATPSSKMSHIIEENNNRREKEEEPRPSASPPSQAQESSFSLKSGYEEEARDLALELIGAIKLTKPDFKTPSIDSWASELEKMLRIDNRKVETCKRIIEWLPKAPTSSNGFSWAINILSAASFRKQFDKLELGMRQEPPRTASDDLRLIEKLEARVDLISKGIIVTGGDYVDFPKIQGYYFKAGEPAFVEKVLNGLRKSGVPIK